ncbi:hypothetical protein TNCV_3900471 [Trichonephila clavipes]|nr:hypothetical protein TNCV_3900471 [Trichonephila clavipes]
MAGRGQSHCTTEDSLSIEDLMMSNPPKLKDLALEGYVILRSGCQLRLCPLHLRIDQSSVALVIIYSVTLINTQAAAAQWSRYRIMTGML